MGKGEGHPVIVWLDPEQVGLVRAVAERAGLRIVGAGTAQRGRTGEVAAGLAQEGQAVAPLDDLRAALAMAGTVEAGDDGAGIAAARLVWLAAPGDFGVDVGGGEGGSDAQVLRACLGRGVCVASAEPIPASVLQLSAPALAGGGAGVGAESAAGGGGGGAAGAAAGAIVGAEGQWARFVPLMRLSKPMRGATDLFEAFGQVRTLTVECWSGPGEGSLGARVFDAMDLVLWLLGEPEQIDAAYAWPKEGRVVRPAPGEALRGLHGTLTANLRMPDGRAGAIVAGDMGGRWNRTATLVGQQGRLRVYDDGFEWIDGAGKVIDTSRDKRRKRGEPPRAPHSVAAIADELAACAARTAVPTHSVDGGAVLAMAGAALLSTRTGEGESPGTILRMVRAG